MRHLVRAQTTAGRVVSKAPAAARFSAEPRRANTRCRRYLAVGARVGEGPLTTQSGGSRRGTRDAENHRLMHELAIDVRPSCFAASPCINWCIYLRPAKPRSQGFCSIERSVPLLPDPQATLKEKIANLSTNREISP